MNLRHEAKKIVEVIKRNRLKKNILKIHKGGKNINFYLPIKYDHIQQQIILKEDFYDAHQLEKIKNIFEKSKINCILDIGANIGNHTLYFCKFLNPNKVYSFEPQKNIFNILRRNIKINRLDNIVTPYNIGVGEKNIKGNIKAHNPYNRGSAMIKEDKEGNTNIKSIDSLKIKEKIDLIKIDTEGFELNVLKGSINTIKTNKPYIWIEISDHNLLETIKLLKSLNYSLISTLREDYLFGVIE